MIGAIIGDFAGSTFEFEQFHKYAKVECDELLPKGSFFSDDTILTVAIADAILNKCDYAEKLREYGLKYENYIPVSPYFEKMFSSGFVNWLNGISEGKSSGNGAMMRISPVGFLFDTEEEVIKNAYLATATSHNSKEAIEASKLIALIILYARQGMTKKGIISKLNLKIVKPDLNSFNYTCSETIDVCLYSLFNSNSFEEAVKLARSFGGDTDTNACIVGGMAQAMFGLDEKYKAYVFKNLPSEFVQVLKKCKINDIKM